MKTKRLGGCGSLGLDMFILKLLLGVYFVVGGSSQVVNAYRIT